MDHASTTPVREEVLEIMKPFWNEGFGNPNSVHEEGAAAREALESARGVVAAELSASNKEVIFTASGTEANNLAIFGICERAIKEGTRNPHFITTNIEHSSVEGVFKHLQHEKKVSVDYVPVYQDGIVDVRNIERKITEATVLVSVMYVNNEIGTVQPISEIGRLIENLNKNREQKIIFHVDTSQAPLYFPISVNDLKVDLLTLDAQKVYGPKGVGALYVRNGVRLRPIMFGGGQEKGLRPGTQNVSGIVGFAKALQLAGAEREKEVSRMKELQEYFFGRLDAEIPEVHINGDRVKRAPNNINISVEGVEGDYLTLLLDRKGVAVSSASACQTGGGVGSRVVRALVLASGGGGEANAVRFSMGRETSKEDIDFVIEKLKEILHK
jgi:cysteine desulfurase